MALTITQIISVTGVSTINGEQVAYFSAQIPKGKLEVLRLTETLPIKSCMTPLEKKFGSEFQSKVYEV